MKLVFESSLVNVLIGGPRWTTGLEFAEGRILAVVLRTPEQYSIVGTATLVAPGIALGAEHVFREHIQAWRAGDIAFQLAGKSSTGARTWMVSAITSVQHTDLAFISLQPLNFDAASSTIHQVSLSLTTPAVGDTLTIFGVIPNNASYDRGTYADVFLYKFVGTVCEVFLNGRDRLVLPFPCLMADFPSEGAMSGSPVFGANGAQVGILSASMETALEEEPTPSYVSLLLPAFHVPYQRLWPVRESLSLLNDPRCDIFENDMQ